MSIKFFGILTHQGAARLVNAAALGTKLDLSTMAVGDGGGSLPFPEPTQTALKGERRRAALNQLSIDPLNGNQIIAEQVIPENEGGWWIREIGLFDKDGTLIAVANCPESYKPQMQEGSGRTQTIRMILIVNSTEALALKIDPSIVLATRKYVDDGVIEVKAYADTLMKAHLNHADPHPQYAPKASPVFTGTPKAPTAKTNDNSTQLATTAFVQACVEALTLPAASLKKTGIVQLSNAITSDSETMAATPKAVKVLADKKLSKAANGADIPDKAQFVDNLGLSVAVVPVGVPLPWPTDNPPSGWIACDGKAFDKKTCPQLAAVYPSGKTPDLRGEFIRGWDNGKNIDTGRKLLSYQNGTLTGGKDDNNDGTDISFLANGGRVDYGGDTPKAENYPGASLYYAGISAPKTPIGHLPSFYSVTRPCNIAFNYIVRAA
ncbi:phage tail protein [Sodalis endosymbiont of Spalangia cameroni]|uniref:phage tail-collar fiber domain-containing protein n=1 Tax=Sodalis praecaptivus TaxID=1239307 RepID=UPI0031F90E8B